MRSFCFTDFNEVSLERKFPEEVRYAVYQVECCPSSMKKHTQGYVELKKVMRFNSIKKMFPKCHIEKRRGTRDEARNYCMKEDTRVAGPIEIGSWEAGGQGSRNDIKNMHEDIKKGKKIKELLEDHTVPMYKYSSAVARYRVYYQKKRNWETKVFILWGKSGVGKTRTVYDRYDADDIYEKDFTKWWDGYDGQKVVLIDEFDGQIPYEEILKICDRYPYRCQVKGGYTQLVAEEIWFTSNRKPSRWWEGQGLRALERRVTECNEVGGNTIPQPESDTESEF